MKTILFILLIASLIGVNQSNPSKTDTGSGITAPFSYNDSESSRASFNYYSEPDSFSVTLTPVRCIYSITDTVTITMMNRHSDTIYVTPLLEAWRQGEWSTIIDDLQSYWDEKDERGYATEFGILQPIAPGGSYSLQVSMTDIARSFPGEAKMEFDVAMRHRYPSGGFRDAKYWTGTPFMLSEVTESEYHLLQSLAPRGGRRDTVFTTYDPINNTPVIPTDIFERRPYRLIVLDPFDTMKIRPEDKTTYMITWHAPSIDGFLYLAVTRRQIWLLSGHDNPNPNELFWLTNISEEQYRSIRKTLLAAGGEFEELSDGSSFSRYLHWQKALPELPLPDKWTDEETVKHQEDFRAKRYVNARKLIEMMNKRLPASEQVRFPDRETLDKIPAVRWESM